MNIIRAFDCTHFWGFSELTNNTARNKAKHAQYSNKMPNYADNHLFSFFSLEIISLHASFDSM